MVRDGGPLAGLDDVPWGKLSHAYGSAEDVPEVLRAVASGDAEAASEAVQGLFGNIWHQGTVYEATPHAVPFLARMAVAGMATGDLADLLGEIAKSDDADLSVPGSAHAAVAAQAGLIAPLMHSPEGRVRMAVTWALAQSGPAEVVVPVMRARWDIEEVPALRPAILRALFVLDPAQGTALANDVLNIGTAAERLVAAWVEASAGLPWSSELSNAATAWLAEGLDLDDGWWGHEDHEPFAELLSALAERGDMAIATRLCTSSIAQAHTTALREKALRAAEQFALGYRIPGTELTTALVPLIADETLRSSALGLLRRLGVPHAGRVLADALYDVANLPGPGQDADTALDCLVALGDPRAPALLAAALADRPGTLDSAGQAGEPGARVILGFDPGLLDALRAMLRTSSVTPPGPVWPGTVLPDGVISHSMLIHILQVLSSWGPQAAPAVPEITRILPFAAFGARVLSAIGDPGPDAIEAVQSLAGPGSADLWTRLTAARALQALSGETGPLLSAIRDSLGQGREQEMAARAARSIDHPPAWLVPALETTLAASGRNQRLRAEVTATLCRFTRDVSALAGLLQPNPHGRGGPLGGYTALQAARDCGAEAEPLVPDLARFLDDAVFCPAAAEAILRAGLGDLSLATLAYHLVTAVGAEGGPNHQHALDLLREIRLRDQTAISAEMLAQLRDLAERPARVVRSGLYSGIICNDEALRTMIRDFLQETGQGAQ